MAYYWPPRSRFGLYLDDYFFGQPNRIFTVTPNPNPNPKPNPNPNPHPNPNPNQVSYHTTIAPALAHVMSRRESSWNSNAEGGVAGQGRGAPLSPEYYEALLGEDGRPSRARTLTLTLNLTLTQPNPNTS